MKAKILVVLISLFSSFLFGQEYKSLTSDAKLRKDRNILSSVITTIKEGAKVEIIYNSHERRYYRVIYKNLTGYIHEKHFKTSTTFSRKSEVLTGKVLFREDFNNNKNNWRESTNASKEFFFRNGDYFIIQRDGGRLTWESKEVQINQNKDFSIEASVTLHLKKNGGAHVMYGVDENNRNYHSIKIKNEKGKKEVFIGKYINGDWEGTWKDAAINEFGASNLIQIIKKGNEINFYINGRFIYTKPFTPFYGNRIGLGCEGVQKASFDYISIRQGTQSLPTNEQIITSTREVRSFNAPTTIKLEKYNGGFKIPTTLNESLQVNAIFDTSASDITLSPDVVLTMVSNGEIKNRDWIKGASFELSDEMTVPSNRFKLNSIIIGNKTITNVNCRVSHYMKVPMILGENILNRYGKYSFNYENGTLTIGEE